MMHRLSQWSLSFLWIFTGITSIFLKPDLGFAILNQAGIVGNKANFLLYGGGILDILIGIWLLSTWRMKACHAVQFIIIIMFTVLTSLIAPDYWLHPFGPITKNIPILCLIGILYAQASPRNKTEKA